MEYQTRDLKICGRERWRTCLRSAEKGGEEEKRRARRLLFSSTLSSVSFNLSGTVDRACALFSRVSWMYDSYRRTSRSPFSSLKRKSISAHDASISGHERSFLPFIHHPTDRAPPPHRESYSVSTQLVRRAYPADFSSLLETARKPTRCLRVSIVGMEDRRFASFFLFPLSSPLRAVSAVDSPILWPSILFVRRRDAERAEEQSEQRKRASSKLDASRSLLSPPSLSLSFLTLSRKYSKPSKVSSFIRSLRLPPLYNPKLIQRSLPRRSLFLSSTAPAPPVHSGRGRHARRFRSREFDSTGLEV